MPISMNVFTTITGPKRVGTGSVSAFAFHTAYLNREDAQQMFAEGNWPTLLLL